MGRDDWYQRTTWSDNDRQEFFARLNRSRSGSNKAMYATFQAKSLCDAGLYEEATELLQMVLVEFASEANHTEVHYEMARSLIGLGDTTSALQRLRMVLDAEHDDPSYQTQAWLTFAWVVAERRLADAYGEALDIVEKVAKRELGRHTRGSWSTRGCSALRPSSARSIRGATLWISISADDGPS